MDSFRPFISLRKPRAHFSDSVEPFYALVVDFNGSVVLDFIEEKFDLSSVNSNAVASKKGRKTESFSVSSG